MRELQLPIRVEQQIEKQQPIRSRFIGSVLQHPGHTCFQLCLKTGEITPATFELQTVDFANAALRKDYSKRKKLVVKENCLYTSALNIPNAKKKFLKQLNQTQKP